MTPEMATATTRVMTSQTKADDQYKNLPTPKIP